MQSIQSNRLANISTPTHFLLGILIRILVLSMFNYSEYVIIDVCEIEKIIIGIIECALSTHTICRVCHVDEIVDIELDAGCNKESQSKDRSEDGTEYISACSLTTFNGQIIRC